MRLGGRHGGLRRLHRLQVGTRRPAHPRTRPKGVNVVFENVGGAILDAALGNLAQRARVVLCGGISSYNAASADEIEGLKNYMALTVARSRMEGFIVLDYAPRFAEGVKALAGWIAEGRIKVGRGRYRPASKTRARDAAASSKAKNFGKAASAALAAIVRVVGLHRTEDQRAAFRAP